MICIHSGSVDGCNSGKNNERVIMVKNNILYIYQVSDYSKDHDYNSFNIVRVHGDELEKLGGRNKWVKIENLTPSCKPIFRITKGLKGGHKIYKSINPT